MVDLRQSFDSNVISNKLRASSSPSESSVLPFSKKMSDELEGFYPDQSVIRNMPLEPCMMERHCDLFSY